MSARGNLALVRGASVFREVLAPATTTLSSVAASGGLINNFGQSNDAVVTLPPAAPGLSLTVILGTTVAKYWRLTAGASDKIYLDGVAGSDAGYVGIASAVAGAALSCVAFQSGAGTWDWLVSTISGTWVAG